MYVSSLIIEEEAMNLNSSEWDTGGLREGKGIGEWYKHTSHRRNSQKINLKDNNSYTLLILQELTVK